MSTNEFYNDGSDLPEMHPDKEINQEVMIQELCGRLDIARQALGDCLALNLAEPDNLRIKGIVRRAIDDTAPVSLTIPHNNHG